MSSVAKVARMPAAEQWAARICAQHQKSVEAVIETGRLLIKAKADLAHGEWGRLFDEGLVPFGQSTADKLMTIARHPVIGNSEHVPNLPAAWGSLYELTKVPERTLKNALKDGVITPDMPRKAVSALMPAPKPTPHQRRANDSDDDTDIYDDTPASPRELEEAFLLRASQASQMATYSGPITPDVMQWARAAADAWAALVIALTKKE